MALIRRRRVVIPLPTKRPIGMGDLVAQAAKALGVEPCEGCERRRQLLNRTIVIGRPRLIRKGENDGR